ncbi:MAG: N-acetyl sugar amidotransferase [Gammaproteobacteria bacterium]|nr:N-acetyl sugar amidotransferase [Gammaproteobacteria bacterium]
MKIKLCKKCVNPSTRPNMSFDHNGCCPVCQYAESRNNSEIDWKARSSELKNICDWGKSNTKSQYDCIVTVSGGKDSTRQACFVRDELGMNPLLVSCSYPPEQLTDLGADNLENLIQLGFDTLSMSLNPLLWKRLMREGFFKFGNWQKSTEMALFAIPIHIAIAYHTPLIFYGENPVHTLGEKCGSSDGNASQLKSGNTIAGGPDTLLPKDVTKQDSHFYYYPSDDEMKNAELRLIYLGYYISDWSGKNNAEFAINRGLKVRSDGPEVIGDLFGFSCLDEDYSIVNQLFKYIKLGFGRVTDQVCELINAGSLTREEGLKLVKAYDGACDPSFIRRFCHYLDISEEQFWEVAEHYRNQTIWKKNKDGKWELQREETNEPVSDTRLWNGEHTVYS